MKNIKKKLIFTITMLIMFIFSINIIALAESDLNSFIEQENNYVSAAPTVESVELSTTFTSTDQIEVYLDTKRDDIEKIVISGWSGGPYDEYLVSKEAIFDELKGVYMVSFVLSEIVNTTTNQIDSSSKVLYYFDVCIYSTNGSMSYIKLDPVQYTESGIVSTVTNDEANNKVLEVTAEEDGYIAITTAEEGITEETEWQVATKGVNTYELPSETDVQSLRIAYKAGEEVTTEDITSGNSTYSIDTVSTLSTGDDVAAISDSTDVVNLIENGVIVGTYATIQEAFDAVEANVSGDISGGSSTDPIVMQMIQDTAMTETVTVDPTMNILFDLNGHTVSSTAQIAIQNDGTFELTDSAGNGVFKHTASGLYVTRTIYNTKDLKISGGNITLISYVNNSNYCIYSLGTTTSAATVEMTGGTISVSSSANYSDAKLVSIYNSSYSS